MTSSYGYYKVRSPYQDQQPWDDLNQEFRPGTYRNPYLDPDDYTAVKALPDGPPFTPRGVKGQKPERYDLIPWDQMDEVARVYGKGAEKYDDRNWELGVDLSLNFAALHRHLSAFWNGQSVDPETECHHLAAVVFHALAMMRNQQAHPDCDDRPKVPDANP